MPPPRHLLSFCRLGLALALALLVMASSVCPRGWFVCLADAHAPALVDLDHVSGDLNERHCDECPGDHKHDGCLDLALALIGDLQVHQLPGTPVLPAGEVIAVLSHFALIAHARAVPPPAWTDASPPTPLVQHVCLQV